MNNYQSYTPHIDTNEEPPVITSGASEQQDRKNTENSSRRSSKKKGKNKTQDKKKETTIVEKVKTFLSSPALRQITGIFLGCLAVYLLISFLSYFTACIKDQSVINNAPIGGAARIANHGGEGGARLAEFLINRSFGVGSFVIIVWLGAMCMKLLIGRPRFKSVNFTIKCFVALITVSLIVGISSVITNTYVNWGGYHAHYVYEFINSFLGYGSYILCFFMVALFVVICLNDLVAWIRRKYQERAERRRIAAEERAARLAKEEALMRDEHEEHIDDIRAGECVTLPVTNMKDVSDVPENEAQMSFSDTYILEDETESKDSEAVSQYEETVAEVATTAKAAEMTVDDMPDKVESESIPVSDVSDIPEPSMVVNVNQIDQDGKRHYKSQLDFEAQHKYQFPPFSLMREGITKISVDAEEQMENKEKIQKTLLDFGIPITKIEATVGPTVTLYEIVPDKGVKIAKIRSLVDDIALSLSAIGVRIIAPIPGKGTVGIEVANKDPLTVSMQTVIKSRKYQESRYNLPVALGSTISNEVYIADLAKMPHLLVAGATGQGKSVGLNAIITSLLYCKSPSQLKFVMIDPKQVEFGLYNKLKNHYLAVIPDDLDSDEPVITDMQKVEATLNSLCIEMDNRYTLLKNVHARNIEEYNGKIKDGKLNPAEGHRFLPYIVVVVDEFGDLIMVSGKNVEMPIARLAQKARAVGMHVIIATQRPSTNVITGIIKANFPARISFKVSSGVDSKTILDTSGAQHLIGRGDMLIFNNSEMVRVQCAFIDTPEVESICEYIEQQPYAPGPYELPEPPMANGDDSSVGGPVGDRDPLFEEVARRVVNSNTASTSSLQRVYSIGYNRAGKIMDQLEAAGIVGPSQGGKPRAVLVDQIGLESILASV